MNGELGFLIEDREIHFDLRGGVGSVPASCSESLTVPTLDTFLGQIESEDPKLFGASVKVIQR